MRRAALTAILGTTGWMAVDQISGQNTKNFHYVSCIPSCTLVLRNIILPRTLASGPTVLFWVYFFFFSVDKGVAL